MFPALLADVIPFLRSRRASQAAVLIYRRSTERVWTRVAHQIMQMSEAEALGYTRAHAQPIVEEVSSAVFGEQSLGPRGRIEALQAAVGRIVETTWERAVEAKQAMERRRAA